MNRTEYITIKDAKLKELFQSLGEEVTNVALIDEENNIDVVVLSNSDWQDLLSQVDEEVKESFIEETTSFDALSEDET
ncbi:hypothetical protein [Enterococcus sp.]|uniref:hypothetical protein n=1 Tax=Enterococcus sp. TaxID=35783 RepID=UPI002898F984|nr:hypothetical protein [Enterococcus sp.]